MLVNERLKRIFRKLVNVASDYYGGKAHHS